MELDIEIQKTLREKYNPDDSVIRRAQLRMLELLKVFDRICRQNNLNYWLAGGTMLGVARHGGFIPWDDDVDVCMPRKDANILKKIMGSNVYSSFVVLQNTKTDPNYLHSSWMNIRDLNSEYVTTIEWYNKLKYRGFQIDIFIVDEGVSLKLKKCITKIYDKIIYRPWVGKKMKHFRWAVNFNHRIFDNVFFPFLRLFKFNDKITFGYGCFFDSPQEKETIYPLKHIEFEGCRFFAPNDIDRFLTNIYGNWRELPKEQDRVPCHNYELRFL